MLDNPQLERVTPWRYSPEPLREPWYHILAKQLKGLEADINRGLRSYRIMQSIPVDIRQEEQNQQSLIRPLPPQWLLWDFNRRTFRQRTEVVWEKWSFSDRPSRRAFSDRTLLGAALLCGNMVP